MEEKPSIDITQYSFDEFVSFVFDHGIPSKDEKQWYWKIDVTFAPQQVCAYYVKLFRNPEILFGRFRKAQLEEGFWAIPWALEWGVTDLIRDPDIPFSLRRECVRAMSDLFKRFFATDPLDSSCHMWWDAVCEDWSYGNTSRWRGGEDSEMQDVMFETLTEILLLDSQPCQAAALHGLGHLHHPGTRELIQRYLANHPSLTAEQKQYALAAASFDVM